MSKASPVVVRTKVVNVELLLLLFFFFFSTFSNGEIDCIHYHSIMGQKGTKTFFVPKPMTCYTR